MATHPSVSLHLVTETPARVCSNCVYALFGPGGVYCRLFHEDVEEAAAVECEAYELDVMNGLIQR